MNLLHIIEGWSKTMGLMEIKPEDQALSEARLKICAVCENANESKVLEVIKGSINKIDTIYCSLCNCPCHEKSLIKKEHCPLNKW